jgi:hypothetical protein
LQLQTSFWIIKRNSLDYDVSGQVGKNRNII